MYVGRIVLVGRSSGQSWVAYRVSSRSFPNRMAQVRGPGVLVSPRDPADLAKNPYIAYNCIRVQDDFAVVSNGDHTDMIFERISDGSKPLDAIALSLVAYGYERDELKTPRIAGAVRGTTAFMGIAMEDEVRAKSFHLEDGDAYMVATYEKTEFEALNMAGRDAGSLARAAYGLPLKLPVCSAAAMQSDQGYDLAVYNPR